MNKGAVRRENILRRARGHRIRCVPARRTPACHNQDKYKDHPTGQTLFHEISPQLQTGTPIVVRGTSEEQAETPDCAMMTFWHGRSKSQAMAPVVALREL